MSYTLTFGEYETSGVPPIAKREPEGVSIHMADGVFIKQMFMPDVGTEVAQHSHTYDHTSMVATGSVMAWADGKCLGKFDAPCGILIRAHVKHTFVTLAANTTIYCIHRMDHAEVEEEQF